LTVSARNIITSFLGHALADQAGLFILQLLAADSVSFRRFVSVLIVNGDMSSMFRCFPGGIVHMMPIAALANSHVEFAVDAVINVLFSIIGFGFDSVVFCHWTSYDFRTSGIERVIKFAVLYAVVTVWQAHVIRHRQSPRFLKSSNRTKLAAKAVRLKTSTSSFVM
jgi:hypothetical protein